MDGIANVAKQAQTQMNTTEVQGRATQNIQQEQPKEENVVKQLQDQSSDSAKKINSKEQVQDIADKLNDAIGPMKTGLKFGVDSQDIFYVSVIEQQTNKMIRRFPAEQAADFLPKMQEVSGMLFDSKG